jgi:hypothetical protein
MNPILAGGLSALAGGALRTIFGPRPPKPPPPRLGARGGGGGGRSAPRSPLAQPPPEPPRSNFLGNLLADVGTNALFGALTAPPAPTPIPSEYPPIYPDAAVRPPFERLRTLKAAAPSTFVSASGTPAYQPWLDAPTPATVSVPASATLRPPPAPMWPSFNPETRYLRPAIPSPAAMAPYEFGGAMQPHGLSFLGGSASPSGAFSGWTQLPDGSWRVPGHGVVSDRTKRQLEGLSRGPI